MVGTGVVDVCQLDFFNLLWAQPKVAQEPKLKLKGPFYIEN